MMFYEIIEALVRDGAGAFARQIVDGVTPELRASLAAAMGSWDAAALRTLAMQISLTLSIALLGALAVVTIKRRALSAGPSAPMPQAELQQPPAGPLRDRWNAVLAHLDTPRENDWKVAVIEADKLVDEALQRSGFAGDTFGDRLAAIQPGTLVSLDGVWWAHKVRNRLAHEPDYFLRYTEARQAVGYFEAALSELSLI